MNLRPQYKSQLYSAYIPPDNINRIIFEAQNEEIIYIVLKSIHEINVIRDKIHRIPPNQNDELINQIKCLPFKRGQIVILRNPQFQDQFAQIAAIDYKTAKIWVKTYPHIDYKELNNMKLNSQKQLNQIKDPSYKAPKCPFDKTKLETEEDFLPFSLPNGKHPRCIKWDGNYFVENFQYVQMDYKEIQSIQIDAIPKNTIEKFELGLSSFEIDDSSFLNGMKGIKTTIHHSAFVFKPSFERGKPSQPLKESKHQMSMHHPTNESEHQNTTKNNDLDLSNHQFTQHKPSSPTSSSTFHVPSDDESDFELDDDDYKFVDREISSKQKNSKPAIRSPTRQNTSLTQKPKASKPSLPSKPISDNLIHQTQFGVLSENHNSSKPFPPNPLNPSVETTISPTSQDSISAKQSTSSRQNFLSDDDFDDFDLIEQKKTNIKEKSSIPNPMNSNVEVKSIPNQSNSNFSKPSTSSRPNFLSDDDFEDVDLTNRQCTQSLQSSSTSSSTLNVRSDDESDFELDKDDYKFVDRTIASKQKNSKPAIRSPTKQNTSLTQKIKDSKPSLPSTTKPISDNLIHQTQFGVLSKNHVSSKSFPPNPLNPSVETTIQPTSQDSISSKQSTSSRQTFLSDDDFDDFDLFEQKKTNIKEKSPIPNPMNSNVEVKSIPNQSTSNSSNPSTSSRQNFLSDDDFDDVDLF